MGKFKVGQQVKIIDARFGNGSERSEYRKYIGEVHKIESDHNLGGEYWLEGIPGSWDDYELELAEYEVGQTILDEDGDERKILAVTGELVALSRFESFNRYAMWLTTSEMEVRGYTFPEETSTTEVSMEQIADKFNIPVKELRVKKED